MNKNMLFDYIYVDDFARFLQMLLPQLPLADVSYNFCSGKPVSFVNLAESIKKVMSVKTDIVIKNEGMNPEYSGDPSKLLSQFPEYRFTSYEENIIKLVDFYKKTLTKDDIDIFKGALSE